MKRNSTKVILMVLTFLLVVMFCKGVNANEKATEDKQNIEEELEYTKVSQLSGKKVSLVNGSVANLLMDEVVPNVKYEYYNTLADKVMALKTGKCEATLLDKPLAQLVVSKEKEVAILPEKICEDSYGVALQKGSSLTDEINNIIAKLESEGTLAEMDAKWTGSDESKKIMTETNNSGENGVLRVATLATMEPMSYLDDKGELIGYDAELATLIGESLNKKVEFSVVDFSGLMPMVQSGKADLAIACISITEERKKTVDLSDPYYEAGLYCIVRKNPVSINDTVIATNFIDELKESFIKTFIVGDRWKLVLEGLMVTLILAVLSGIFGTIFGFGVCILRLRKNKILLLITSGFIRIIQCTPVVVMLMVFYYIIFSNVDISPIIIAIICFSINFGVYVSEMMRTGIEAVDKGQIEASKALGFSNMRAFWKIIFPQAARHFLPVFKGEFISMVKMTSVVGYIAIQDLTKVSDIIRSNTLEAFFPLIMTAIIYFIVANILIMALSCIEMKVNPKRHKNTLKGVKMKCY